MASAGRWETSRRTGLLAGLIAICGFAGIVGHIIAGIDGLGDATALALNVGALVLLTLASLGSMHGRRHMGGRATRIALVAVSAGFGTLTVALGWTSYPDMSIELASLLTPEAAAAPEASMALGPGGDDIRFSGDIDDGAADRLSALLDAHPKVARIALTSDGGVADEGKALGDVIAAHHLVTYVPDFCVSACTLAFAGGRERLLMKGARLGYHGPYAQGVLGQTFEGDPSDVRADYIADGIDAAFVDEAMRFGADDMWFPKPERLLAAHVVTGYVDRFSFPDSMLDGHANATDARAVLLRNFPVLDAVRAASPRLLDRLSAWYLTGYRRGATEGEDVEGLKAIVRSLLVLTFVRADDATLLDLARYLDEGMAAAPDAGTCAAIGRSVDVLGAEAKLEARGSETADAEATALTASALASKHRSRREASPMPLVTVALPSGDDGCTRERRTLADIVQRRDPSLLRRRLGMEMRQSLTILADVVDSAD